MADSVTFDILLLGLVDPSADGRARFCDAMEHLTGEPAEGFQAKLRQSDEPLFHSLRPDQVTIELFPIDVDAPLWLVLTVMFIVGLVVGALLGRRRTGAD